MLKIAICEDSPAQLAKIRDAAEAYFAARPAYKATIDCYAVPLLLLEQLDKTGSYDIVLLDVCMPGLLGTEVAEEIRARHSNTEIVFLSSSREYAVDAFALKAAHYLLKPFDSTQFAEAMDRAMARFAADAAKCLAIKPEGGGAQSVDIEQIDYIESWGHQLSVHTKKGLLTEGQRSLARLLEELEALSPGQFIMPYKGFIVNHKSIRAIEPTQIVLQCGVTIPIPKRGYRSLQNAHFDYMFGEGLLK
ncbi:MAG: LytTR family DNA-binding domain-containing protein [Gemmiger sp.]|nr:LytTR family DNA-binding domain-containing protein [Gemmiger sp.]